MSRDPAAASVPTTVTATVAMQAARYTTCQLSHPPHITPPSHLPFTSSQILPRPPLLCVHRVCLRRPKAAAVVHLTRCSSAVAPASLTGDYVTCHVSNCACDVMPVVLRAGRSWVTSGSHNPACRSVCICQCAHGVYCPCCPPVKYQIVLCVYSHVTLVLIPFIIHSVRGLNDYHRHRRPRL